jgi:hypothetical protein
MAGSSLLVALNALLLRRTRLPGIRRTRPVERPAAVPALQASTPGTREHVMSRRDINRYRTNLQGQVTGIPH